MSRSSYQLAAAREIILWAVLTLLPMQAPAVLNSSSRVTVQHALQIEPRLSRIDAVVAGTTNAPAAAKKPLPRDLESSPEPAAKRKTRFLAAFGLITISLLVLATGIALMRAFRQR